MAKTTKKEYGNESISQLKGADRVRKRPGVIFGSDGLEGCEHAVFEILSNSIDEAREGHGKLITVTRYLDHSIEVEDQGRGCPVDWNAREERYNWELVYCELYAGGKYNNNSGDNYEYSLGLNGLGSCATQYASRYMDVTVWRDGNKYSLHFEKGEVCGEKGKELKIEPTDRGKKTGTLTRWLPDLEVFTDIAIPAEYYVDVCRRQAVVNAGLTFRFRNEVTPGKFETQEFLYENGIADYVADTMKKDTFYLIGAGTTTRAVMRELELENTLIGVDLVYNYDLVANDIYGQQILDLIGDKPTKLVVTVTGGQGFLFGRGNQQLTPEVLRRIGKENIIILATKEKILKLRGQPLLVDTGDAELDQYLSGYHYVICDYNETIICKVCPG